MSLKRHEINGVVVSQKIEQVGVGIEPIISTFPACVSDRYAIGPIGPTESSHGHP